MSSYLKLRRNKVSNTYRRKKASYLDYSKNIQISSWDEIKYETKDHKKIRALMHVKFIGDKPSGHYNAPSWYSRKLNKKCAFKNKALLAKAIKDGEEDGFVCVVHKKTANRDWF